MKHRIYRRYRKGKSGGQRYWVGRRTNYGAFKLFPTKRISKEIIELDPTHPKFEKVWEKRAEEKERFETKLKKQLSGKLSGKNRTNALIQLGIEPVSKKEREFISDKLRSGILSEDEREKILIRMVLHRPELVSITKKKLEQTEKDMKRLIEKYPEDKEQ